MFLDALMLVIAAFGIALSAAYLGAEYVRWRSHGAAERRRDMMLRALHAARLADQSDTDTLVPEPDPAGQLTIWCSRRSATRALLPRTYAHGERRKRARACAQ